MKKINKNIFIENIEEFISQKTAKEYVIKINVRPAYNGEQIKPLSYTSYLKNYRYTANKNDFIATTQTNEEFIISKNDLENNYQKLSNNFYKTKKTYKLIEINQNIEFRGVRDEMITLNSGDYICYINPYNYFSVTKEEFLSTFTPLTDNEKRIKELQLMLNK